MKRGSIPGLAALALLAAAGGPAGARGQDASRGRATPPPVQGQRGAVRQLVGTFLSQLRRVAGDPGPAPERPPPSLKPCGSLYNEDVRKVALGPEMAWSYNDWLIGGFNVIRENGGLPLPICFATRRDTLVSNQGRFLLHVNNQFMKERFRRRPAPADGGRLDGYVLTGHTDPAENDTALARRRAEWLQARSPLPACRYTVRTGPRAPADAYQRRVTYAYQPVAPGCFQSP